MTRVPEELISIDILKAKAIGQGCHFGEKAKILHGVSKTGVPVPVPDGKKFPKSVANAWLRAMGLAELP